jgi:hypothetical protein
MQRPDHLEDDQTAEIEGHGAIAALNKVVEMEPTWSELHERISATLELEIKAIHDMPDVCVPRVASCA